jgi:radical SAM protein with 4Fe4S-binding SPASM domain
VREPAGGLLPGVIPSGDRVCYRIKVMSACIRAPEYVQVFVTLRCNRRCGFCFNRGLSPMEDMALADFDALLGRLAEAGVREVDILGGEPTLHGDIHGMAGLLRSRQMRATMSANGTRVDVLAGLRGVRVGISMNGEAVTPALDAYVMKEKPMLKSLCESGGGVPGAVRPYLRMPGVRFFYIYPDALSTEDLAWSVPYPRFLAEVRALNASYGNVEGVSCGFLSPDKKGFPADVRCPAGTTKLSVLPDGTVYPCYLLSRFPEFALGNILRDGWDRLLGHPVLRFFRHFRGNPCPRRGCSIHGRCHGGCPAVSLLVRGDLGLPDPRCRAEGTA